MRHLLMLAMCALTAGNASPQPPAGHFSGAVTRFGSVQTVEVDVRFNADSLSARYSIPDLGLYDEPASASLAGDTLRLHLWYGDFACLWHPDIGEITGVNGKWQPPVSLHLKRTPDDRRYHSLKVTIPAASGRLQGRLYLPDGPGPHPGIVVVPGSGDQGLATWTYRSWGNYCASRGVAALVYDKRGIGGSDGDPDDATFADLAADAVAAYNLLRARPDIDSMKVGMMGISQGGWLVPMAMRQVNAACAILLVAPAVDVWTQEQQPIEFSIRAEMFDSTEIARAVGLSDRLFDVVRGDISYDEFVGIADSMRHYSWFQDYFGSYTSEDSILDWRRQEYDPREDLSRIKCPTLVIYGENDIMVPPSGNADLMRSYLSSAPTASFRVVILPDVGHDLMTGQSLVGTSWDWPSQFWRWNRRPAALYDTIAAFLSRTVIRPTNSGESRTD